jgi:hypothetical protein
MIIPCMKLTSASERGGSVARVDGGSVLLGFPGAPGCTTTGFAESVCCVCAAEQKEATTQKGMTHHFDIQISIFQPDESLPLNANIFKNSFQPATYPNMATIRLEGFDFDEHGLAFAFAALGEPSGEAFGETFGSEAIASFDAAVGDGERVVEIGGVGEIAHAELVEPIERAGVFLAEDDDVDGELLRVHASILAVSKAEFGGTWESKIHSQEWLCYPAQLARGWGNS